MDEDQYILRLPDPLVERMRFALSSTKKRETFGDERKASSFKVHFHDKRTATFTVDGSDYPASLMDLPTLIETHKTADKRTFYKSSDLHQVLVVRMPDDPPPEGYLLRDGLTVAARDAGRRLAPPKNLFSHSQVESVEHRVKYVIDHKVKFAPKKDRVAPPPPPAEEELVEIEEEATTDHVNSNAGNGDKGGTKTAEKGGKKGNEGNKLGDGLGGKKTEEEEQGQEKEGDLDGGVAGGTAPTVGSGDATLLAPSPMGDVEASPLPMTPAMMTPGVMTPMGDGDGDGGEDDEEDEDEDDDDFAEMAGELMEHDEEEEAKKRIERVNVDGKIGEKKKAIAHEEGRAARAPNKVMKERIMVKVRELRSELTVLESARAALGE